MSRWACERVARRTTLPDQHSHASSSSMNAGRLGAALRAAWRSTYTPALGAPRWALICAFAVPLAVLPSCLWRIGVSVLHRGDGLARGDVPGWMPMEVYVVALSVVSELLAFTAVGMVATWGEHFPRWLPILVDAGCRHWGPSSRRRSGLSC